MTGPVRNSNYPAAHRVDGVGPWQERRRSALGSAALALHVAYQAHRFTRMKATVAALFPTRAGAPDG